MLRIDVDGDGFPANPTQLRDTRRQPFRGRRPGRRNLCVRPAQSLAAGLRPRTGDFYIADVGQGEWEEIDIGQKGANYGWPVTRGRTSSRRHPHQRIDVPPIYFYDHSIGQSITGGYVYRGEATAARAIFLRRLHRGQGVTLHFDGTKWVSTNGRLRSSPISARSTIPRRSARMGSATSMSSISVARSSGSRPM